MYLCQIEGGGTVSSKLKSETPDERVCRIKAAYIRRRVAFVKIEDLAGPADIGLRDLAGPGVAQHPFEPGERVFPLSQAGAALLAIEHGAVDIFVPCGSSRRFVKRVTDRTVFGQLPEFGFVMHDAEAEAALNSTVFVLDAEAARAFIGRCAFKWLAVLGPLYSDDEIDAYRMLIGPPDARTARLLLDMADRRGVIDGPTHVELADRLQLTREGFWRILSRLRKKGLLAWKRRQITLLDLEGLRQIASAAPAGKRSKRRDQKK
jgi:CRP-like cAMP-binding protein